MIEIVVFLIVFFIGYLIFGKKKENNPYIITHLKKWQNEKQYDEYIKWLDKNKGDIPLSEVKFKEDLEVLNEINKNFKK